VLVTKYFIVVLVVSCMSIGAHADDGAPVRAEAVDAQSASGSGEAEEHSAGDDAGIWEKTRDTSERAWEATRDGVSNAAGYTYEKAGEAWETTRDGTGTAIRWSREKSERAWAATKEGTGKAVDWTIEKSGQVWDATKESAGKTGDAVKRGYERTKEKAGEMVDDE
jgi:hypothetical protein